MKCWRCLEGVLWALRTCARWRDLPREHASRATCSHRHGEWERAEVWLDCWRVHLGALDAKGLLGWEKCFIHSKGSKYSTLPRPECC